MRRRQTTNQRKYELERARLRLADIVLFLVMAILLRIAVLYLQWAN